MRKRSTVSKGVAVFILSLLFCSSTPASAGKKIIWPYVCFKPVYICENGKLTDGSGYHILNLVWQSLADYEHQLMQMPIKRVIEFSKEGRKLLFYGMYKTPERMSFLEFSLPCRISPPTYLVIRKGDRSRFGESHQVSLKKLLEDQTMTFLYLKSVSFGKGIDELLERHKSGPNIMTEYDTTKMVSNSLNLLKNKRVDYMLSLDGTGYGAKAMGLQNKIAYLSIQEQNHYEVGYITAPKNEWGKQMIKRVNTLLRNEIKKEGFFQLFSPLVDESLWPELRQQFNEKILNPSQVGQKELIN